MMLFTVLALALFAMSTTNIILWVAFIAILVLYLGRRKSRKAKALTRKRAA